MNVIIVKTTTRGEKVNWNSKLDFWKNKSWSDCELKLKQKHTNFPKSCPEDMPSIQI